jgi:hypothetical protein
MEASIQFHAPVALRPREDPRYLFVRRLGGPQSRSGRRGVEGSFIPFRESNLGVQLVTVHYTSWTN